MIIDALTNPPMPDWNELGNEARAAICDAIEDGSCCCHARIAHLIYGEIRDLLLERERRVFRATMGMQPSLDEVDATSPRVFETAKPLEDNDER